MKLAFKFATHDFYSQIIKNLTKSPYSHVEFWIDGDIKTARCISSREPAGVSYQILDLSDAKSWTILEIPGIKEGASDYLIGFCDASVGKIYDFIDLLDALHGKGVNNLPTGRFCSGICTEILQRCFGLFLKIDYWTISPGHLFDMVKGLSDGKSA